MYVCTSLNQLYGKTFRLGHRQYREYYRNAKTDGDLDAAAASYGLAATFGLSFIASPIGFCYRWGRLGGQFGPYRSGSSNGPSGA